jgi:hypothetical protein
MGFTARPPSQESTIFNPNYYALATDVLSLEMADTLYLSKSDYRMSYLSSITMGEAAPMSALVVDANRSITGLNAISCSALTVGGVAVGTLPSFLTAITPGTAATNKALVLDGSGAIATIASLSATNIYGSVKTPAQPNILSIGTQNSAIATEFMNDSSSLLTYASWTNLSPIPVSCKLQMSNQGVSFIGTTNHQMRLGANGSNILYLQPSGNVSIGSSLDTHKLYVGGSLGIANQTTNLLYLPTVQCPGRHPASPKRVKAAFPPAFCHHHSNNRDPEAGWGYLTREEARLLSIARAHDWPRDCLDELIARDLEAQMDAVHVEDAIDTLATSEDEETKDAA